LVQDIIALTHLDECEEKHDEGMIWIESIKLDWLLLGRMCGSRCSREWRSEGWKGERNLFVPGENREQRIGGK